MKHAFLIMAHDNWDQLKKLITLLDDSRNSIYVHIDASAHDFNLADFTTIVQNASLFFTPRIKVSWGGSSQIDCEMLLLKEALSSNSDYYHLLSGKDLPLHNMDYINNFFLQHKGKEFVHFTEIGDRLSQETLRKISIWYPFQNLLGRQARVIDRILQSLEPILGINRLKAKSNIVFGKGANWFSITNNFAHYIVNVWPNFKDFFSSTLCADEIFLQTILLNSPYVKNIYHAQPDDDNKAIMRLIDWNRGNPYVFQIDDFESIILSPMLFARKFDQRIDDKVIDKLFAYLTK